MATSELAAKCPKSVAQGRDWQARFYRQRFRDDPGTHVSTPASCGASSPFVARW